jgi:hypothetical protein
MVFEMLVIATLSEGFSIYLLPLLDPVQAVATVLSVSGAFLVASPQSLRRSYGFGIWMVSNLLWVVAGIQGTNPYLIILFGIYFYSSFRGYLVSKRGHQINEPRN